MNIKDWHLLHNNAYIYIVQKMSANYRQKKYIDFDNVKSFISDLNDIDSLIIYTLSQKGNNKYIRFREFERLIMTYINQYKVNDNDLALYTMNDLYLESKVYFPHYFKKLNRLDMLKKATDEDIKYAKENFNIDCDRVMTYRGHKFYISLNNNAFILNDIDLFNEDRIKTFSLDYDWWVPIDCWINEN